MASGDGELDSPRARASKARVLVVEDDAIVGSDIKLTLIRLGYAVVGPLPAAVDAMAMVLKHQPDVVLMDIHTKGTMDGVEAARILRQRMRVPVIFLTAHSDPETVRRAGQVEPLGYVVKPFKAADLASVIEVALHRHAAENAMRERDLKLAALTARLTAAIESLDGAVLIENEAGLVELMNSQLRALLAESGLPEGTNERRDFFNAIATLLDEASSHTLRWREPPLHTSTIQLDLLERRDGRFLELSAAPTMVAGAYGGCLWTFRDVTEREQTKRALEEQSLVDELTGLHNRRGLHAASQLLRQTVRDGHRMAVYFIDLDGMKAANDEFGHDVGDALLRRTAEVLRGTCRGVDVVARLGGDEFVVVSVLEPPGELHLLARIREAAAAHNLTLIGEPPVRMSIGLALGDDPSESFDALLARADGAMYRDKQHFRSTGSYQALGKVK
ncbi:MAG TPA: diguanylate cyclase [Polyangiales bacterium]|nr:diguanylate cyclase [Polyangiales bacterium]